MFSASAAHARPLSWQARTVMDAGATATAVSCQAPTANYARSNRSRRCQACRPAHGRWMQYVNRIATRCITRPCGGRQTVAIRPAMFAATAVAPHEVRSANGFLVSNTPSLTAADLSLTSAPTFWPCARCHQIPRHAIGSHRAEDLTRRPHRAVHGARTLKEHGASHRPMDRRPEALTGLPDWILRYAPRLGDAAVDGPPRQDSRALRRMTG